MIRALVVLAAVAHSARAEVVQIPNTNVTLTIGDEWHAVRAKGLVAAYKTGAGALLAGRYSTPSGRRTAGQNR